MKKLLLAIIILLSNYNLLKSQDWVRTFTDGKLVQGPWAIESYDKGYMILDNEDVYSWIIKTDINGNKIWEKRIGNGINHIYLENIEQTLDNGFILGGGFGKYDPQNNDPVIIKLNSCGELDWCSVINTVGIYDFGTRVKPTPDGDYILVSSGSVFIPCENVQLFKFDSNGFLLWKHTFCPDSLIWDPLPNDVRVDSDGYLISSSCYYPDPGNPTIGWERPYFIKTDTAGNLLWYLVYGSENGYHGITWDQTIKSSSGNYYAYGWHSNFIDSPCLVKITGNGQESYYQDVLPGPGGLATASILNDTTLIIQAGGHINGVYTQRWINADTMGMTRHFVEHLEDWMTNTTHTFKTFDNKFLSISQGYDVWIYIYKFNSNLDYDSIYTHQYIYDSLCPGGVISDTINPDCGLITAIEDPKDESELSRMKIYPNPASNIITVEFPKYLKQIEKKSGITSTSFYYQWKSTILEVDDINGRQIISKEIPKDKVRLELDVSAWTPGMYYFRLIYHNQSVGGEKVIIQ